MCLTRKIEKQEFLKLCPDFFKDCDYDLKKVFLNDHSTGRWDIDVVFSNNHACNVRMVDGEEVLSDRGEYSEE